MRHILIGEVSVLKHRPPRQRQVLLYGIVWTLARIQCQVFPDWWGGSSAREREDALVSWRDWTLQATGWYTGSSCLCHNCTPNMHIGYTAVFGLQLTYQLIWKLIMFRIAYTEIKWTRLAFSQEVLKNIHWILLTGDWRYQIGKFSLGRDCTWCPNGTQQRAIE